MTAAELKYLLAIDELYDGKTGIKLTAIATKMDVTKVSVHRAVERLDKNGYTQRDEKNKVIISEYGYEQLQMYRGLIRWISNHLQEKGNIPEDIAIQDAINAACSFSDVSLKFIAGMVVNVEKEVSND